MTDTLEEPEIAQKPPVEPRSTGDGTLVLIVNSSVLKQALTRLNNFVPTNPVVPVLEDARVAYENETLTIRASDLYTECTAVVPVMTSRVYPASSGILPIKPVLKLLTYLPEQPITLTFGEKSLTIHADAGYYEFKELGLPADFPASMGKSFTPTIEFTVPAKELKAALTTGLSFTSGNDLRPAMTGVLWQVDSERKGHTLVGTDGHSLVKLTPDFLDIPQAFTTLVPRGAISSFLKALPSKLDFPVSVAFCQTETNKSVRLAWGAFTVYARLIDERFPDYQGAIPTTSSTTLVLNRSDLIAALRRTLVFTNTHTHQLRFDITGVSMKQPQPKPSGIKLSSENLDYSSSMYETVSAIDIKGNDQVIGFNGQLLLRILLGIATPTVELRMQMANKPVLIYPVVDGQADTRVESLAMPVMLNTYP